MKRVGVILSLIIFGFAAFMMSSCQKELEEKVNFDPKIVGIEHNSL